MISNAPDNNYDLGLIYIRDRTTTRYRSYMKWDISNVPTNVYITDATLNLYLRNDGTTATMQVYHVYDDTWDGQSETTITYNNQVCGSAFDDATDCNLTAQDSITTSGAGWKTINVTEAMRYELRNEDDELSLALKTPETAGSGADSFDSSEAAQTQPNLSITYIFYPNITLIAPETASTTYVKEVGFRFKVTDDTAKLNCTLWGNFSGSWDSNETVLNLDNNTYKTFLVNLSQGVYEWNVQCNDSQGLSSFASNRTLTVTLPDLTLNDSSLLTNDVLEIDGADFPPNSNITLNVSGDEIAYGYPITILADGSGSFTNNWTIPLDVANGSYTVRSYITNNSNISVNDTVSIYSLEIITDKTNYLKSENVTISVGTFTPFENVTLHIIDKFLDPASEDYPKNITADANGWINDNWTIPDSPIYGLYTINATETNYNDRTVEGTFEVVKSVVETDNASYEQGFTVNITGYGWGFTVNVTLNITDPDSIVVYGPINVTSNGTGYINSTWTIPYGATTGDYTVAGIQPSLPEKQDTYNFTVDSRPTGLTTEYAWYKDGEIVNITITGMSPDNNVTVDIQNSSGSAPGYPQTKTANSSGGLNFTWAAITATDNYTISAVDDLYNNLNASKNIEIVKQYVYTDDSAYNSGEDVTIRGKYWDRDTNVTIEIRNSTDGLAGGYPKDVAVDAGGQFLTTWTAQPGESTGAETYNISCEQKLDSTENDSVTIDITKAAWLTTDATKYQPNSTVQINGSFYAPDGDVILWIRSLDNGGNAYRYPKLVTANAMGDVNHTWNTLDYCSGNYIVESVDQTYPEQLFANTTFDISYVTPQMYTCTESFGADCSLWPAASEGDNTFNGCPTSVGNAGDENVQDVWINATLAIPGAKVEVTCQFDPFGTGTEEYIYYYNGSGWTQLYSGNPDDGNVHNESATVIIHNKFRPVDGNLNNTHIAWVCSIHTD